MQPPTSTPLEAAKAQLSAKSFEGVGVRDAAYAANGYDPLRLLLASIGSPVAGPILAVYVERDLAQPLTAALGGRHAAARAALIVADLIGFVVVRLALRTDGGGGLRRKVLSRLLG